MVYEWVEPLAAIEAPQSRLKESYVKSGSSMSANEKSWNSWLEKRAVVIGVTPRERTAEVTVEAVMVSMAVSVCAITATIAVIVGPPESISVGESSATTPSDASMAEIVVYLGLSCGSAELIAISDLTLNARSTVKKYIQTRDPRRMAEWAAAQSPVSRLVSLWALLVEWPSRQALRVHSLISRFDRLPLI